MDCNVFIIHGIYGTPEENWFPWLKKELEALGCRVFVPRFPNPGNPKLSEWLKFFDRYKDYLNKDSVVVGHSMGVAFLLRILENHPARAAFFVASVIPGIKNKYSWSMKTFIDEELDWSKIKNHCKQFFIYNSDNDPYIPLSKGKELAENLNSKLILVKNAGHFNTKAKYTKFELLLNDIKRIIAKDL